MHLSKFAALGSLFVADAYAQIDSNCSSATTVFVTVTAFPVTKTVSIPFEVSPSIISKYDLPPKLQVALDTSTDITATSTEDITLIRVVATVPTISTPAAPEKGLYYFTADDSTTVWRNGKIPPAGVLLPTSTAVVTNQPVPLSSPISSGGSPEPRSYSTIFLTVISKVFETETVTTTAPAATISSVVTVSSFVSVPFSKIAPFASSKPFTRLGSNGWNATFRTLRKEKLVGSANEPAKLLSQQTGVKDNLATRPGTVSLLATSSSSSNATNNIGARQLGSIVVATIDGVAVSWTNSYDGADLTTSAPVVIPSDAAPQNDLVPTSAERYAVPVYPWNLQPAPVQVFPTSISASSKTSKFKPPRSQSSILSQQSSVPTELQRTLMVSHSSVQQPAPTTIITSVVPVLSVFTASPTTASASRFSNTSSASESAITARPSCTDKARFTIDFDDLPHFSTSGAEVDIPPIFNPYRKLYFEDHYGYVPPPSDPFPPISPPQLAVYRANQGINVDGSPDAGLESVGEFGAGPRASDSAYWIDVFSLWLGCENVGPSDCVITINGYDSAHSTRVVSKTVTQPPCPGLVNCKLTLVEFTHDFRNLAGIQILAAVDRKLTAYYIDDVSLGWSNNTCAAQQERSSTR